MISQIFSTIRLEEVGISGLEGGLVKLWRFDFLAFEILFIRISFQPPLRLLDLSIYSQEYFEAIISPISNIELVISTNNYFLQTF